MKSILFTFAFIMISLTACAPTVPPTNTAMPASTIIPVLSELEPTFPLPTPIPTSSLRGLAPDAIQLERWKEYQIELARCVLSGPCDADDADFAFCEWDILGRSGQEVYIWAQCASFTASDQKPVVVYLESDGSIKEVKFGGYKEIFYDLTLFPAEVQEKIYLYSADLGGQQGRFKELRDHLRWRQEHPEEPPLTVLSATPQP